MLTRAVSIVLLGCCSAATLAKTYPVVEPDPMEEIQERLKNVDVQDYMDTPREEWSVFKGESYPVATKSQVRRYVPWYTTEFDIRGQNGKVVYPKGFTFNPLKFTPPLTRRMVFFKLDHYEKLKPLIRPSDELIADSGDVVELSEKIDRHISLVEPNSRERLGLRVVPSIIEQKGELFEIKEISLADLD
ncbi:hypothetical protein AB8I23_004253 [Vibrio alginolyticus]